MHVDIWLKDTNQRFLTQPLPYSLFSYHIEEEENSSRVISKPGRVYAVSQTLVQSGEVGFDGFCCCGGGNGMVCIK